jgi:beta-phosphoglucomutase-like phosphatase (HAD superfamily)
MPDADGRMREITTPLHGTGDNYVYYWLAHNAPGLKERVTLEQWLEDELRYYERAAAEGRLKERDGVSDALRRVEGLNGPNLTVVQGVVTGGSPRQLAANLKAVRETRLLAFRVDAETVCGNIRGKSYISGQVAGLRALNAVPENHNVIAAAIEDSRSGVRRALSDDVDCVVWPSGGWVPEVSRADPKLHFARAAGEVVMRLQMLAETRMVRSAPAPGALDTHRPG